MVAIPESSQRRDRDDSDREECLRLMERYGMLENIIAHSLEVTKVALLLSTELNRKGQTIDLCLVEAASLLHDIAKTLCIRTKEDHTQAGCRLLKISATEGRRDRGAACLVKNGRRFRIRLGRGSSQLCR